MVKLREHKYTIDMYMYLHVYEEDISMTKGNLSWHLTCDKVLYGSNQRFSIPWSYNV